MSVLDAVAPSILVLCLLASGLISPALAVAIAGRIDALNEAVGRFVSWVCLLMVITTAAVVVLRYVFSIGFVWMQESYVWMHGAVFMLGAGYTLLHDGHVRVDVFYRPASPRFRAWVNLIGVILLLLPVLAAIWWTSLPYVETSWSRLEASREAGGLPGLFLFKTIIPAFCFLVALQGLSLALRSYALLKNPDHPASRAAAGEEV